MGNLAPFRIMAAATIILASVVCSSVQAIAQVQANPQQKTRQLDTSVFQLPQLKQDQANVLAYFRAARYRAAENLLSRLIERYPKFIRLRFGLAVALVKQGKQDAAIEQMTIALTPRLGDEAKISARQAVTKIGENPRFASLMVQTAYAAGTSEQIKNQESSLIVSGTATVGETNTGYDSRLNILKIFFRLGPNEADTATVLNGDDPAAVRLNQLYNGGLAAGNYGDLYDNRDNGHSRLRPGVLPQIAQVTYLNEARQAGQHYGLNSRLLFNLPTIGNSSTALAKGRDWRSQARLALTNPGATAFLYLQYINSQLYVYPEHRDHDPGHGDLLTANTPYLLVSQGSSGSDQAFLRAIGAILAAFKPAVKSRLRSSGLLMPTVQMVFRKGLKTVRNNADYLSAKAHPSVFQATDIDLPRMIRLANEIDFDTIPPLARISVLSESAPINNVEIFSPLSSEKLFDTPYAISRIIRSTAYDKKMTLGVTAWPTDGTKKVNYRWVVLRGDSQKISIKPRAEDWSQVELIVPWHDRRPLTENPAITTDRVDIAVFSTVGGKFSAPSFLSILYPGHQNRTYDQSGKILKIAYNDPIHIKRYVDPRLFYRRNWRDEYRYDSQDRLLGWRRIRQGSEQLFTRHGALATKFDDQNRPTSATEVAYKVKHNAKRISEIIQAEAERTLTYVYSDDDDRYGRLVDANPR